MASYALLRSNSQTSDPANIAALKDAGFSAKQSEEFAKKYPTVVTQFNDTATSFSATVFKDASRKLTLAIRGTLELTGTPNDLTTDGDIATSGAGYDQIVAMANWWLRASTPTSGTAIQYKIVPGPLDPHDGIQFGTRWLQIMSPVAGTGELVNAITADPDHKLDITGHSLGGHVAALLAEMVASFEGSGAVGDIVTYNAPATKALTYEVQNWLGRDTTVQSGILGERHLAVIGEAGVEVTAGLGQVIGTRVPLFIEDSGAVAGNLAMENHSIVKLSDSLALYDTFSKLSPALTQGAIKGILEASSNTALNSLETALDALRALLIDGGIASDSGKQTPSEKRDVFYKNLYELQNNGNYKALSGSASIVATGRSTGDQAKTDFGSFLSLDYLLPITLTGADDLLATAHQTEYDAWKADQDLTPEQKANGEATYSDPWYRDRADMLTWKNIFGDRDVSYKDRLNSLGGVFPTPVSGDYIYQDVAAGITLDIDGVNPTGTASHKIGFGGSDNDTLWGGGESDRLYGGGGMDRIDGDGGDDYIEGNGGADIVTGGEGKDQLLGGAGTDQLDGGEDDDNLNGGKDNDTLKGGTGSDRLYGGAGSDTYEFSTGDGTDTIVDWDGDKYGGDGQGSISFDGQGLSGSYDVKVGSANQWGNATYTFAFTGIPGERGLLTISKVGGTDQILIPDYKNGELGITLNDMVWSAAETTVNLADLDSDKNGVFYTGSDIRDTSAKVIGTAYNDIISGGLKDDLLIGGDGYDNIIGGDGNDRLYGGTEIGIADAIAKAEQGGGQASSSNEVLNGGEGDDLVVADTAADVLGAWPTLQKVSRGGTALNGEWRRAA